MNYKENKIIQIDGEEFYLIPKSKKVKLPTGVKIKFDKVEQKTHFDIKVKGWCSGRTSGGVYTKTPWITFRRIENEDGSYTWTDWSTGGVTPIKEHETIVESWYQNHILK